MRMVGYLKQQTNEVELQDVRHYSNRHADHVVIDRFKHRLVKDDPERHHLYVLFGVSLGWRRRRSGDHSLPHRMQKLQFR